MPKEKVIIVITFILIFFATRRVVMATPTINNADISNNIVTISGSGFLTKDTPNPLTYDSFEDGTVDTVADMGIWSDVGELDLSTNIVRTGNYSGHKNFTDVGYGAVTGPGNNVISPVWFVSYWIYLDDNWEWGEGTYGSGDEMLSNLKNVRFWNPGNTLDNIYTGYGWNIDDAGRLLFENINNNNNNIYIPLRKSDLTFKSWHNFQVAFKESSAQGAYDGRYTMWLDGRLIVDATNILTKDHESYNKRPRGIGLYNAWAQDGNGHDNDMYIDDIYADNSLAHIEICAGSLWTNKEHCEIQIPTAWADDFITATLKQGSFSDGDYYLYVVDGNGEVNQNGYPITIGNSSSTTNSRADVNQDNQVNTTDALLTLRKSLGLGMSQTNWNNSSTETGDVNCNNSVTTADALLLLRQSVGLDMSNTEWCGS